MLVVKDNALGLDSVCFYTITINSSSHTSLPLQITCHGSSSQTPWQSQAGWPFARNRSGLIPCLHSILQLKKKKLYMRVTSGWRDVWVADGTAMWEQRASWLASKQPSSADPVLEGGWLQRHVRLPCSFLSNPPEIFFSQQRSKNHPPTSSRQQTHIWSEKCHLPASSPPLLTRRAREGELLAGRPQETIGGQPLKKRHNSATRRVIPELQTVTEVGAFGRTLVCLGPRFGARRKV